VGRGRDGSQQRLHGCRVLQQLAGDETTGWALQRVDSWQRALMGVRQRAAGGIGDFFLPDSGPAQTEPRLTGGPHRRPEPTWQWHVEGIPAGRVSFVGRAGLTRASGHRRNLFDFS
jgi:hypothetical protein